MTAPSGPALEAVRARRSWSKVTDEAPTHAELLTFVSAAGRVADHSSMRPWRLIELRGDDRVRLGAAIAKAENDKSPSTKPLRAPLLIAVVASYGKSDKVPRWEQEAVASGSRARPQPAAGRGRLGRHLAHRRVHPVQGRRQGPWAREERGAPRLAVRRRQAAALPPRPAQGRRGAPARLADAAPGAAGQAVEAGLEVEEHREVEEEDDEEVEVRRAGAGGLSPLSGRASATSRWRPRRGRRRPSPAA